MPTQNRKSVVSILVLTFLITSVIFLISSCGNNVFGKEEYTPKNITEMLELAETDADYVAIIDAAKVICNDVENKYEEAAEDLACAQQAEALSYKNGIDLFSTLIDIQEIISDSSKSIYDILSLRDNDKATYKELSESAELYNELADKGSLTESQQISRGIVNTYSLISLMEDRYIITITGRIVNRNDITYETDFHSFENLNKTVDELESENKNFASNAVDGFKESGSLSDEQTGETDQVDTTVKQMIDLRTAAENGTSLKIDNTSYDFSGENSTGDKRDDLIDQALAAIFENQDAKDGLNATRKSGRIN